MSSSSGEEIPVEPVAQENRELNLIRRFDFWAIQDGPQRGAVILRFLGFGVVRLVGINPDQARVGDIAVEVAHSGFYTSARAWLRVRGIANHFVRLYIPGVEDLFQEGDRLLQVEHSGSRSRLISWRVWRSQEGGWRFQQQSTDEQRFSTLPSNFEPLTPVYEGAQSEFDV
ncbi:unnamed protein product [Sphagnum balticum]